MSGSTFETLMDLDARLTRAGHHPLTPWWQETLRRWYQHPTALTLVARVGRGGAKSHTSAKVALNEALFGNWPVPPGERHFFAFVSVNKEEAAQRLALLESFLTALRIDYKRKDDTIALTSLPIGFRVFAAEVASASGFRAFGKACDELAKVKSGNEFSSPAVEVVTSLDAMTVTHAERARSLLVSSPFSVVDYHAERYALGDTDFQLTAHAPTWIANGSISEEQTHALARHNERLWRREYAAIPDQAIGSAFDAEHFEHCYSDKLPGRMVVRDAICALDPSHLRGDGFAALFARVLDPAPGAPGQLMVNNCPQFADIEHEIYGLIRVPVMEDVAERTIVRVDAIRVWGDDNATTTMDPVAVVDAIAAECKARGIKKVVSDQCLFSTIAGQLGRKGLSFKEYSWNADSKEQSITLLNAMARSRSLSMVRDDLLRREISLIQAKAMPSGKYHFDTNGRDAASALITLGHALGDPDVLGHFERRLRLHGLPHGGSSQRHEVARR